MSGKTPAPDSDPAALGPEDAELLRRGIRLNTMLLGLVAGLGTGFGLYLITHISLLVTGDKAGYFLNLLGVIFPGYSASPGGAVLGLFWGFVLGAVSGGFIYYMYARTIGAEFATSILTESSDDQISEQPVLRMSGHSLGLALGSLAALQLFLTTGWLIVRGTAEQSPHAWLLQHYLPGYRVTWEGGLIGAAGLFLMIYVFSRILAGVYNFVASRRRGAGAS